MENFTVSRGKWREYDVKVTLQAGTYKGDFVFQIRGILPPMTRLSIWIRIVTWSNRSKITAATGSLKMMTEITGLKLY